MDVMTLDEAKKAKEYCLSHWVCGGCHADENGKCVADDINALIAVLEENEKLRAELTCEPAHEVEPSFAPIMDAKTLAMDILKGLYGCERTWSAWSYGSMHKDDFYDADDGETLEAAIALIEAHDAAIRKKALDEAMNRICDLHLYCGCPECKRDGTNHCRIYAAIKGKE